MAEKRNDGGPAYPVRGFTVDASGALCGETVNAVGMSLRDWFAGQALVGILSSETQGDGLIPMYSLTSTTLEQRASELAYKYADAMLSAREGAESK